MEIGHRPWGFYEIVKNFDTCKIKRITVYPHSKLSLQSHNNRAEHWTCLSGSGQAQINGDFIKLERNVHVFINIQDKHRLINTSDENLVIIEIQTGEYFGEDDITRYEDDYGRV